MSADGGKPDVLLNDPLLEDSAGDGKKGHPPPDSYNMVYLIMLLMGAGNLFPYNALVTAVDYFDKLYPGKNIEFLVPIIISYPSPVFQMVMIRWGHAMSFTRRIVFWFLVDSVVLILVPIMGTALNENSSMWLLFFFILMAGVATAILQASIFGFASMLPPKYTTAIMSGQGVAGLVVSVARIITKASFDSDLDGLKKSALVYFVLAAFVTFMCVLGYVVLLKLPFTRYFTDIHHRVIYDDAAYSYSPNTRRSAYKPVFIGSDWDEERIEEEVRASRDSGRSLTPQPRRSSGSTRRSSDGAIDEYQSVPSDSGYDSEDYRDAQESATKSNKVRRENAALHMPGPLSHGKVSEDSPLVQHDAVRIEHHASSAPSSQGGGEDGALVLCGGLCDCCAGGAVQKVWKLAIVVFSVFVMTFLVYPGLLTELPTSSSMSKGWFAVILITQFNFFDLIGRSLPRWFVYFTPENLWIPVSLRFLLYPLFVLCASPRVFGNDVWIYVFGSIFAISNGYLATLAMMFGPQVVDLHERESAGYIMSFALNLGILVGSHVALGMRYLDVGHADE